MFKKYRFNRICRRIKEVKIQGASNVAKAALKAYYIYPNSVTKRVLLHLRPTEPMLTHVLVLADKIPQEKILDHFKTAQNKINLLIFKLIKNNSKIFTHCHSTNVVNALIYAKKQGKNFQVYNTETRPLFQGRKTAKELSRTGIKVTNFVDSAADIAIKQVDVIFLGADALLEDSVINKVGSGMISELAKNHRVPVYIVADSWKYSHKDVKIEQRDFREVWDPKKNRVHVDNPAFEAIELKYISGIVSELGKMSYKKFLSIVRKRKD